MELHLATKMVLASYTVTDANVLEDGGGVGTVVKVGASECLVLVTWDVSGQTGIYRMGCGGKCDLTVAKCANCKKTQNAA